MEKQNILDKKGQHIRSGREFISTSYFLCYGKLRCISYDIKTIMHIRARRACHCMTAPGTVNKGKVL